jgi:hypothetical protein
MTYHPKNTKRMTLEEMELALARIDLMIDFLQKQMNCHAVEDIAYTNAGATTSRCRSA